MIKTIDVECNAANPNLPLKPMFAFVNSPSSIRVRNVPKRIGDWCIRKVYFTAVYPDSTVKTAECVLTGGVWVGTIEGTNTSGTSTNGYTIFADGTDENGNNVTGYVLGKGDIEILEADGTLSPDPARYTVKLLSAEATQPREGDMYPTDDGYVIWQDGEAHLLGTPFEQITSYVESAVSAKADLSAIPLNTSQLSNDSGFITSEEVQPYYVYESGTLNNTGVATRAAVLASTIQSSMLLDKYGTVSPYITFDPSELTPKFSLQANYVAFFPWKLSKFFDQTYSPELELVWWYGKICRVLAGMFIQSYTGFMWRTKGIGFAIPCDQNGIPDGRLYEITQIEQTSPYRIGFNNATQIHTITGNENWSAILTIDEQENQITCTRSIVQRAKENRQTFPTLEDIPTSTSQLTNDSGFITSTDVPTKTSDLTNDSGFITSADIITKRDLNDLNIYVDPMADMTTTKFTVVVSYAGDPSTPLFTAELTHRGGEETTWTWSPSGSNQRISIDYYSTDGSYHLSYLNLQDGGGTEHSGSMTTPLTSPYWTGEVQDDWFHFSVTSQTTTITTKAYVDSLIAALEARIATLEGN